MTHDRVAALIVLAGCGATPRPHSVTLQAPAAAAWSSATVLTHYRQVEVPNSMIGGSTTYDASDVELVVRRANGGGRTIPLVSMLRNAFGATWSARDVARIQFRLRSSADGAWLVISGDGGASWLLVDPEAALVCRHLGLRGDPETFWRRLPAPAAFERDLAAAAAGTRGGGAIDHGGDELELELAREWIVTQLDRADLAPLAVATVLATPDDTTIDRDAVAALRRHLTDPAILAQVRAALAEPRDGHLVSGVLATELLWGVPDVPLQALLAGWIARAAEATGVRIYEYEAVSESDWSFARAVWDLDRLVQRDRTVTAEAEQAAIAVIARASRTLTGPHDRPWTRTKPSVQASVTYAVHILIAAHTPAARRGIEAAVFDRSAAPIAPRGDLVDPLKDYEVRPRGANLGAAADVDGVFAYALGTLADVR